MALPSTTQSTNVPTTTPPLPSFSLPGTFVGKRPPLKTQGIKTALVGFIGRNIQWNGDGHWIEPFAGTCSVALNLAPPRALLADSNPHIIGFMKGLQDGSLDPGMIRSHLEKEGALLLDEGAEHYYRVRKRFNTYASPLDFLFLVRSCFNGLMRFNKSGGFNVPFCKNPSRFSGPQISKITNQAGWAQEIIRSRKWEFVVCDWRETIAQAGPNDFVYLDPPYVGRHTDYFGKWEDESATSLPKKVQDIPGGYAASMWASTETRSNEDHLAEWNCVIRTTTHRFQVGPKTENRPKLLEALLIKPGYQCAKKPEV